MNYNKPGCKKHDYMYHKLVSKTTCIQISPFTAFYEKKAYTVMDNNLTNINKKMDNNLTNINKTMVHNSTNINKTMVHNIVGFVTIVTQRMQILKNDLFTPPEHMSSCPLLLRFVWLDLGFFM